jgi:hypothetical protein
VTAHAYDVALIKYVPASNGKDNKDAKKLSEE